MDANNTLKQRQARTLNKLAAIEAFCLCFSMMVMLCLVSITDLNYLVATIGQHFFLACIYTGLIVSFGACLGLYHRDTVVRSQEQVPRMLLAVCCSALVLSEFSSLLPTLTAGVFAWVALLMTSAICLLITRYCFTATVFDDRFKRRVLVLGAGRKALQFAKNIGSGTASTEIVGYLHQPGERELLDKNQVIYSVSSLRDYMLDRDIEEIVVAVDDRRNGFPLEQLLLCRQAGIEVTSLLDFYEREVGAMHLDNLDPSWLIFAQGFKGHNVYLKIKDGIDYVLAVCGGVLLSPLWLIGLLVLSVKTGPRHVFKKETIIGRSGKELPYFCLNSPEQGSLSYVLNFLKTPQLTNLLNVVLGHMSLIGPLPVKEFASAANKRDLSYIKERNRLKPGLIAWCGFDNQARQPITAEQQLQYDLYYIKNCSFFLDFTILIGQLFSVNRLKSAIDLGKGLLSPS